MTKVTKYQAKDGSLHNTAREQEAADRKLRIAPAMEKFVNSLVETAPGLSKTDNGDIAIYLMDLPKFLSEHAEAIRDSIVGALTVRRPRKPKAPAPAVNA